MGTFTENFREIREKKGYSLLRLSNETGIHRSTLSHYQSGHVSPPLCNLILIADTLHVSLDDLAGHTVKPSFEEMFADEC